MPNNTYFYNDIMALNRTQTWCRKPIKIIQERNYNNNEEMRYIIYATGDADMNGRKYIALPYYYDVSTPHIKSQFNLL
jgi:hypothetical protein